jgi:hypothetical protein
LIFQEGDRDALTRERAKYGSFYKTENKMAVTYRVFQTHNGGNHGATIIEDNVSQKRIGIVQFDPARNQFAFNPDNNDLVLSAVDQASLVAILNSLSK